MQVWDWQNKLDCSKEAVIGELLRLYVSGLLDTEIVEIRVDSNTIYKVIFEGAPGEFRLEVVTGFWGLTTEKFFVVGVRIYKYKDFKECGESKSLIDNKDIKKAGYEVW